MVTPCEQNSGIRFDVSLWPSQKIEVGYAKHSDDGKGGCGVELRGARLGVYVDSPENESLTGLQVGVANRTGDVNGVNLGILFSDIGKSVGLNIGLLWNKTKVMNGVQLSLLSNDAGVANGSLQVSLVENFANRSYNSAQLSPLFNKAVRLDNSVQLAGLSNFANGIINAGQFALGINSTEHITGSLQIAALFNMVGSIERGAQLAFLANIAMSDVPNDAQYALCNF